MNALLGLVALALLTWAGWMLVGEGRPFWVRLALAHLAGTAIAALLATLLLPISPRAPQLALMLLAVVMTAWTFGSRRQSVEWAAASSVLTSQSPRGHLIRDPKLDRLLLGMVTVGIVTVLARALLLPLDWDGWAIWQLKAKALVDGSLQHLLTDPAYVWSHQDYPLLTPLHSVWLSGAWVTGVFREKATQTGGLLFLLDLLVLFRYAASERLPRTWVWAGLAVILSWPLVMKHAVSGFADLPLAAYALGTVIFLPRGDLRASLPLLAGAVLTKNEGVFTLAAAVLITLLCRGTAPITHGRSALVVGAIGLLPFAAWSAIKRSWGVPSDLLDPGYWHGNLAAELPGRIQVVLSGFVAQAFKVGPWYPGWGLLWPIAAGALVLSLIRRARETFPCWLLAATHFAGAAAAYLVTPANPALHLDRSLDRLWLHVAPAVLLATLFALHGQDRSERSSRNEERGPDQQGEDDPDGGADPLRPPHTDLHLCPEDVQEERLLLQLQQRKGR